MSNPHPHDIKVAKGTYDGFISLLKWAVPLIALIALFVVILIA